MEFLDAKPIGTQGVNAYENEVPALCDLKQERVIPMLGKRKRLSPSEMRLNREKYFRKLAPKNPIQLMNEIYGLENETLKVGEIANDPVTSEFRFQLMVGNEVFVGQGRKKATAKLDAYDKAFEEIYIKRNAAIFRCFANNEESKLLKFDLEALQGRYSMIISYILYNYFSKFDYDSVSQAAPNAVNTMPTEPVQIVNTIAVKANAKRNQPRQLPPNAHLMNPSLLMNTMRPEAKFVEMGRDEANNFVMKLEVDGKVFISAASSKKGSKNQCAQLACENIFNIEYPAPATNGNHSL